MGRNEAEEIIKQLIGKYELSKKSSLISKYSEEDTKKDFILPLFASLGWDTINRNEVTAEESQSSGRVDYGFYLNGRAKFFLEAKSLKTDLHREEYAHQAIRYSWNKGVTWAVLTDFESIKVFNADTASKYLSDKLYFEIHYTEFLERFDQLWLLSKEAFQTDSINIEAERSGKKLQKISITNLLYKDLNKCRDILINDLSAWNEHVSKELLDEGVQRLLDRLVFIRVAEDRGIEPHTLIPLIRNWENSEDRNEIPLYKSMVSKFREFDAIYNSNLFSPHPFEQWEDHSEATKRVINILYGKEGYFEYDFKIIPADILGTVYENYLGYKLSQSQKGLTLDKDASKRKEQGIYYTPSFIVDFIARNTLKPILNKCKSVNDLKRIKVLDPACGSGSFLIKALEIFLEKYKEFNYEENEYLKTQIITENLYGVDLDEQAVEITRLNLLINALGQRDKLPPLDQNIKNGNSLISGSDEELKKYFGRNFKAKKPFNWQEEFPEIFKQGGFDVITGNPPWGATIDQEAEWFAKKFPNSAKSHKDTYKIFIDNALFLLKRSGYLGFINPSAFLYQPRDEDIKTLIANYKYSVINLGEKIFKGVTAPCCILIIKKEPLSQKPFIIDLTQEKREDLSSKLFSFNYKNNKQKNSVVAASIKNTGLTFDTIFSLKDAGIQYHRFGIGLSNKGGNDLYDRIFCKISENKFKNSKSTWYGKLIGRYWINEKTDEYFNLDFKKVLKHNEAVSFTEEAFNVSEKILWRQTASGILAVFDGGRRWFRNTIQCAWIRDKYKNKLDIFYSLAIFNSRYIDFVYKKMVLETGRVFPQVKITYLKLLPFVIGTKEQQSTLSQKAKKMITLNKQSQSEIEGSDKWNKIKSEIERIDKEINKEVYKLYGLTTEEIGIVGKRKE